MECCRGSLRRCRAALHPHIFFLLLFFSLKKRERERGDALPLIHCCVGLCNINHCGFVRTSVVVAMGLLGLFLSIWLLAQATQSQLSSHLGPFAFERDRCKWEWRSVRCAHESSSCNIILFALGACSLGLIGRAFAALAKTAAILQPFMFHQCCFVSAQGPNSAVDGIQSLFRDFIVAQFIMHKTSLLIYIPVISPTWSRAHAIASGKRPGSLFQISRRAIALIVSIWPLKQTWGFSSTVKAPPVIPRSETLLFLDHAAGPREKASAYMPPRVLFQTALHNACAM